ncbi:MAG: TRAM domain-containing protein [Halobacteriota archaeon]
MNVSDNLLCLYTAIAREEGTEVVFDVPAAEIDHNTIEAGDVVQIAVIDREEGAIGHKHDEPTPSATPEEPPVSEGEIHRVEIESVGEQGDGIAKVDRGYVLVVPKGEPGDELTVEIDTVTPTVGFAEIVSGQE